MNQDFLTNSSLDTQDGSPRSIVNKKRSQSLALNLHISTQIHLYKDVSREIINQAKLCLHN